MTYIVFDTETDSLKHHKDSKGVIAVGYKGQDSSVLLDYNNNPTYKYSNLKLLETYLFNTNPKVLVGFNIKFDLLWFWNSLVLQDWLKKGGQIWDCQLVEYMLTYQSTKYPSLDNCSKKYGGTLKDKRLEALWDAGTLTSEIPTNILLPYLEQDVLNTEKVFLAQLKQAKTLGLLDLIKVHNDYLLLTTEIQYNGLKYDINKATIIKEQLNNKLIGLISNAAHLLGTTINIASNDHVSACLFGGSIKYKKQEEIGIFKTGPKAGTVKTKWVEEQEQHKQLFAPASNTETLKPGVYTVDEGTLSTLRNQKGIAKYKADILDLILEFRGLKKLLGTYIDGFIKELHKDFIHPSFVHVSTETGRLSCKAPNVQNIPRDKDINIKELFVSRFGKDGLIVEIDLAGAELLAAGIVSGDLILLQDIVSGIDLHKQSAAFALKKLIKDITPEERQAAKTVNFGLLYGKSVKNLARDVFNRDETLANLFSNGFYNRYKTLKRWQEDNITKVFNGVYYPKIPLTSKKGNDLGLSVLNGLFNRRFILKQVDWEGADAPSFSRPDIKNYPVQAAAADIAFTLFSTIYRTFHNTFKKEEAVIINTVHDSLIFDVRKENLINVIECIKLTFIDSKKIFKDTFNYDLPIGIGYDIKVGSSWGNMQEYKEEVIVKWHNDQL